MGKGKGNGIVEQTPAGDDIPRAVALQSQKEMSQPDLDTKGSVVRVQFEPEVSPTVTIFSDSDIDSTDLDSKHHGDVDKRKYDDVGATDAVDLDGNVDVERDHDDEEEEDEEEKDDEEHDEEKEDEEEEEEDEDEEEDKDEDDGKEPRTIGQGEMVNTSANDVDTMVDDQPIMLPAQGQNMGEHTPRPQPRAPAPQPQSLEPFPRPQTPETHPLSRPEHLGLVTPETPCPAVPTLRGAEAARDTSDVDVDQQLLIEWAGGHSLPYVPLADVPLPEARLDASVGHEFTSPRVAEEAMIVAFGPGSGSCLVRFLCCDLFISSID